METSSITSKKDGNVYRAASQVQHADVKLKQSPNHPITQSLTCKDEGSPPDSPVAASRAGFLWTNNRGSVPVSLANTRAPQSQSHLTF